MGPLSHVLHRAPLRRKLTFVIVFTSAVALMLACLLFIGYEWFEFRRAMVEEQTSLGRIVGANVAAALLFDDAAQAVSVLEALRSERRMEGAAIYTPDGRPFARFSRDGQTDWTPPALGEDGHRFQGINLETVLPISFQGERIGTICLLADGSAMRQRLIRYGGIVAGVLAFSMAVALGLSSALQSLVTQPILGLAETAREVSARRDYSVRARAYYDDEVGRLVGAFNDMLAQIEGADASLKAEIAERVAAEAKLRDYTARLQASNRELQDFAHVASHDLQEPLRKIQAFGERLRTKYGEALGETGQDYLSRMADAAARMQTLINDLLQFSRVTTKARPFVPVDLNDIARGVLSDLEVRIDQTRAEIEMSSLPTIDADGLQMRQLFQNLIGNALKFHKPDEPPRISVEAAVRNGTTPPRLELTVKDKGIGFEPKHAERIFVIFQRLHGRGEYQGTGVGLAICKKIVERHGGSISASSQPGAGSTFHVALPVHHDHSETPHEDELEPADHPSRR